MQALRRISVHPHKSSGAQADGKNPQRLVLGRSLAGLGLDGIFCMKFFGVFARDGEAQKGVGAILRDEGHLGKPENFYELENWANEDRE